MLTKPPSPIVRLTLKEWLRANNVPFTTIRKLRRPKQRWNEIQFSSTEHEAQARATAGYWAKRLAHLAAGLVIEPLALPMSERFMPVVRFRRGSSR
jgi:hypothetical protein